MGISKVKRPPVDWDSFTIPSERGLHAEAYMKEMRENDRNFDETLQGLLEAVEIKKGNIPLVERKDMPAKTFYAADEDY